MKARKPISKSELVSWIAKKTGHSASAVREILDAVSEATRQQLKANGVVTIPGIAKLTVQRKPARPARMGTNPFTGEKMKFKAKPASQVVKARVVAAVKTMCAPKKCKRGK